jgi:hypothetical protein
VSNWRDTAHSEGQVTGNPTENVSLVADLGADSQHGNLAVPNYMIGNATQEQLG